MKIMKLISTVMVSAALSYAADDSMRPESSIPTPAEASEISREMPDLSAKDRADWQKMRAERKQAREQILSRLKESSAAEKQSIRQDVSKNRNVPPPRTEGDFQQFHSRERGDFSETPDSRNMKPKRDMPGPPPPPREDGHMRH